jgi:CelD/BcsL family acetyltransferase involved in cellulose biosynthesis
MQASVVRPNELGAAELSAWRAMQAATPELDCAFLSAPFTLAVGRARSTTRVAVLEDGGEIVGFLPFDLAGRRTARPIAPGVSDAQGLVHVPGLEWSARELLAGCGVDVWEFDHLIAGQLAFAGQNVVRRPSPVIDLSGGYDAYISERRRTSKETVKSTRYKQRKLEREVGESRFEFDATDRSVLSALMQWKSAQYRRTGRRDRFAVRWIQQLVFDLFETRSDGCSGTLSVLYAGPHSVAAHFGLRSESRLSSWFPSYDMRFARYSPGLSLHFRMAEAAAAAGLRCFELGKGDERYKQSLKSGDLWVGEGWVDRPSVAAVIRRARRAPRRHAVDFIMSRPALRQNARRTRAWVGSLRGIA